MLTVPENGDRVGNLEELFQFVGDVEACDAFFFESSQDGMKCVHFKFVQSRGGLVEDENLRIFT
jgi:hypothetical protein